MALLRQGVHGFRKNICHISSARPKNRRAPTKFRIREIGLSGSNLPEAPQRNTTPPRNPKTQKTIALIEVSLSAHCTTPVHRDVLHTVMLRLLQSGDFTNYYSCYASSKDSSNQTSTWSKEGAWRDPKGSERARRSQRLSRVAGSYRVDWAAVLRVGMGWGCFGWLAQLFALR